MFASIQRRFEVHCSADGHSGHEKVVDGFRRNQLFSCIRIHILAMIRHDSIVCYLYYDAFVPAKDGGQPRKLKAENLIVVEDRLDRRKKCLRFRSDASDATVSSFKSDHSVL